MPSTQGDATEQTPPDLPSYLFKERIVYLVRAVFSGILPLPYIVGTLEIDYQLDIHPHRLTIQGLYAWDVQLVETWIA